MGPMRWDVFCRVVDNYGDAGVCWRLARQCAAEHAIEPTLWIDRLATLARFAPQIDAADDAQSSCGVTIRRLDDALAPARLPDVVIEGFGCGLPAPYVAAMQAAARPPVWINLEYLSAEPWVDSVHAMASPQPRADLTRYFWFPGFTAKTGGLIREKGLLEARDAFRAANDDGGSSTRLRVLLFCYPNRALTAVLDAWCEGDDAVECTVPEGVATAALDRWLHGDVPCAGRSVRRGRLGLTIAPFGTQDAFDRMLWRSDVNFVRGEDSFVRAQWAARPFVWQPYPQDEGAHRLKLDAFLARYTAALAPGTAAAVTRFSQAFDDEDGAAAAASWPAFRAALDALDAHGRRWADDLARLPELTSILAAFTRSRL